MGCWSHRRTPLETEDLAYSLKAHSSVASIRFRGHLHKEDRHLFGDGLTHEKEL